MHAETAGPRSSKHPTNYHFAVSEIKEIKINFEGFITKIYSIGSVSRHVKVYGKSEKLIDGTHRVVVSSFHL